MAGVMRGGGVLDRRDVLDLMHGCSRIIASLQCLDGACRVFTDQAPLSVLDIS